MEIAVYVVRLKQKKCVRLVTDEENREKRYIKHVHVTVTKSNAGDLSSNSSKVIK